VEVDPDDPGFRHPTKPIGRFFSPEEAKEKQARHGWIMREDSGRGWRRLVPSPVPLRILEIDSIRHVVKAGAIPIAAGGGGIPVIRRPDNTFDGVEAVVDKDLAASLVARRLAADVLLICTAVPHVSLDFGTERERPLRSVTADDMAKHLEDGQFPAGSMGPKIRASLDFVRGGGVGTRRRAIITDMNSLQASLSGKAGTVIVP
jgi:carbamate kinase